MLYHLPDGDLTLTGLPVALGSSRSPTFDQPTTVTVKRKRSIGRCIVDQDDIIEEFPVTKRQITQRSRAGDNNDGALTIVTTRHMAEGYSPRLANCGLHTPPPESPTCIPLDSDVQHDGYHRVLTRVDTIDSINNPTITIGCRSASQDTELSSEPDGCRMDGNCDGCPYQHGTDMISTIDSLCLDRDHDGVASCVIFNASSPRIAYQSPTCASVTDESEYIPTPGDDAVTLELFGGLRIG
ncbi:hypothetical protein BD324DRAFT_528265 [Kockovaella imperatae]|uniref:Uncharacterized protein n=1 Tax=Kockovaella imperatae TaxID=4999 RepID=A0A1Y1UF83_9TREE|nr:hypothetical protein BD324DRAFT_528265 [Kockovaella imperatae]ORX36166.1 hypothetical protein BD324DRAFT_528265 [Kockovaella imperatae]